MIDLKILDTPDDQEIVLEGKDIIDLAEWQERCTGWDVTITRAAAKVTVTAVKEVNGSKYRDFIYE